MALVKLEIDGKRIIAVDNQTILAVARENGIGDIPTLCHDEQLEPFTSCYVCVVKVKGARSLLPACSTKVTDGMVVETGSPEVQRSRKAAIELLLSSHNADCVGPCQQACPAGVDIQGYVALAALGRFREAIQLIKEKHPLPAICNQVSARQYTVSGIFNQVSAGKYQVSVDVAGLHDRNYHGEFHGTNSVLVFAIMSNH